MYIQGWIEGSEKTDEMLGVLTTEMAAYLQCPSLFLFMISMANGIEFPKSI